MPRPRNSCSSFGGLVPEFWRQGDVFLVYRVHVAALDPLLAPGPKSGAPLAGPRYCWLERHLRRRQQAHHVHAVAVHDRVGGVDNEGARPLLDLRQLVGAGRPLDHRKHEARDVACRLDLRLIGTGDSRAERLQRLRRLLEDEEIADHVIG